MPTPQEARMLRLKSDYKEMCNIRGQIISWRAIVGTPPYVEEYLLTLNVRSIIGPEPEYRDQHVVSVEVTDNYPATPPSVVMVSDPNVFHPNWWIDKHWCYGTWDVSEGLGHFVIRMIRTLQFDPIITNENSPANEAAMNWYLENQRRNLFPCDQQTLPNPSTSKNESPLAIKKMFRIHG
jgi:ubiquitin-protein ligase